VALGVKTLAMVRGFLGPRVRPRIVRGFVRGQALSSSDSLERAQSIRRAAFSVSTFLTFEFAPIVARRRRAGRRHLNGYGAGMADPWGAWTGRVGVIGYYPSGKYLGSENPEVLTR